MKKISVIIPTYNRANLINIAISSILNQTFKDFEIIIVDDGSTDNTEQLVKGIEDSRIKYIKNDANKGHAEAKNIGIRHAQCDFITFQDSDDESLPTRLEEEYQLLSSLKPEVGFVYSRVFRVEADRKYLFPSPCHTLNHEDFYKQALNYGVYNIYLGACLFRKSVFEKVGLFNRQMSAFDDFEFFIRAAKYYKFHCLKKPLAIYNYSEDSVCANEKHTLSDKKKIFCYYYKDIKKSNNIISTHFREIGHSYCFYGNLRKGKIFLQRSFVKNPLNLKSLILLSCALFGRKYYRKLFILLKRFYMNVYSFFMEHL